jgi:hypothetical protein
MELAYLTPVNDSVYELEGRTEKYGQNGNEEKFLNWYEILGSSGFAKGLNEIQPVPGGYAKLALNFEWGSRDNFITALEAGVMADVFYKRVPVMIETENSDVKNQFLFMQAYISVHIGKRSR